MLETGLFIGLGALAIVIAFAIYKLSFPKTPSGLNWHHKAKSSLFAIGTDSPYKRGQIGDSISGQGLAIAVIWLQPMHWLAPFMG